MIFNKSYVNNSRVARDQLSNRDMLRNACNVHEQQFGRVHAAMYIKSLTTKRLPECALMMVILISMICYLCRKRSTSAS